MDEFLTTFKILIIGESMTGKSSILIRFVKDEFNEEIKSTIGFEYKNKKMEIDGDVVGLAMWDTAGVERYRSLTPIYYRNAQGVILVYDVTQRNTFNKLDEWLREVETYCGLDIVKMVVGNKIDLPNREVSTEEGMQFARKHKTLYVESSAKTAEGIECCFEELVRKIYETPGMWEMIQAMPNDSRNGDTRHRIGRNGLRVVGDLPTQARKSNCNC